MLFAGATDLAGNHLEMQAVTFTPFDPRSVNRFVDVPEIRELLEKCPPQGGCNPGALDVAFIGTTLFLANGVRNAEENYSDSANPARLIAVNVDNPFEPQVIGWNATSTNPRALAAVADALFPVGSSMFAGDLLFVAGGGRVQGGELAGKLEIYDVTPCTERPLVGTNCLDQALNPLKGVKFLSTPLGVAPRSGVPPDAGVPLQITALHSRGVQGAPDTALIAYISTSPIGIEAVIIPQAFNMPVDASTNYAPDALARGEFLDVGVLKNRAVAVEMVPSSGQFRLRVSLPNCRT